MKDKLLKRAEKTGWILEASFNIHPTPDSSTVYIDSKLGRAGVEFPKGTPTLPVDNIHDALAIAKKSGIDNITIQSAYIDNKTGKLSAIYSFYHSETPYIKMEFCPDAEHLGVTISREDSRDDPLNNFIIRKIPFNEFLTSSLEEIVFEFLL
jgi:hypothetical protein